MRLSNSFSGVIRRTRSARRGVLRLALREVAAEAARRGEDEAEGEEVVGRGGGVLGRDPPHDPADVQDALERHGVVEPERLLHLAHAREFGPNPAELAGGAHPAQAVLPEPAQRVAVEAAAEHVEAELGLGGRRVNLHE